MSERDSLPFFFKKANQKYETNLKANPSWFQKGVDIRYKYNISHDDLGRDSGYFDTL